MRLTGRDLTVILSSLMIVVLAAGAVSAWAVGRHRADVTRTTPAVAHYVPGPSADRSVRLSGDAHGHPRSDQVRRALQGYFDAINTRDYRAWVDSVAPTQSLVQDPQRWARDYSTTVDSNLLVTTVSDEPLRARILFTSQQSVNRAPPDLPAECVDWDLTYLLSDTKKGLVLSGIDPSAQSMTAC